MINVRIIESRDIPPKVWDWIERGNYDGNRMEQDKVLVCPLCGGYALMVWTWNGGYGKHPAWRCMADRDHQGPLIKMPQEESWVFGKYEHYKLRYDMLHPLLGVDGD